MPWHWLPESPLHYPSPHIATKTLFECVTDELARYFQPLGARYSRSRSKLTFKRDELKLEIGCWSRRSNIPGEHITLEIIPSFYSASLAKANISTKGYFFGHPAIFYQSDPELPSGTVRLIRIFESTIDRLDFSRDNAILKYSNRCNIYNLTPDDFLKITAFVENRILSFFETLGNASQLNAYLAQPIPEIEMVRHSEAMVAYLNGLLLLP